MSGLDTIVGLDLGRHAVKAAWVQKRGKRAVIRRTEQLLLPADLRDTRDVIAQWVERTGLSGERCAVRLPGQHAIFQPFRIPAEDPRTPEQAAAMEVVKFNEMASESMVHGHSTFTVDETDRRLLLAMARPSLLDQAIAAAQATGVEIVDVIPGPVAFFSALESLLQPRQAPVMAVNIGHSATEIAVGAMEGLMFARAFSGGGQMFTEALAKAEKLSSVQAENLKLREGSLAKEGGSTAATLRPVAELWVSEVQSCLSVYGNLFSEASARPSRVVLCGGGAALDGLPEFVAEHLQIETARVDALPDNPRLKDPARFTTAVGLGRAALGLAKSPISLLPSDLRDELTFRTQKPFWIAAGITAALILAVSLLGGYRDFYRRERHLRSDQESLRRRQSLVSRIESTSHGAEQLRKLAVPLREMIDAGPRMLELVTLIAEAKAEDDWIWMVTDGDSYFAGEQKPEPDAKPYTTSLVHRRAYARPARTAKPAPETRSGQPVRFDTLIVEGFTSAENSLASVRDLISRLAAAEYVVGADHLEDDRVMHAERPDMPVPPNMQRFALRITLNTP